jgi:hypothetical protein
LRDCMRLAHMKLPFRIRFLHPSFLGVLLTSIHLSINRKFLCFANVSVHSCSFDLYIEFRGVFGN